MFSVCGQFQSLYCFLLSLGVKDSFEPLGSSASDELALVGKLPFCTESHIIGLPIPAMVESTFNAVDTSKAGEHTLDFHLEIRQRVTQR